MKKLLNNKGVSLIEIVAALVLLSIVAVPLGKTFIDSFKFQARGQIKTEANKVNEYVAEQLKKGNYSDLDGELYAKIKEWKDTGNKIEFEKDKLPSTNITAPYNVTLEKISVKNISERRDAGGEIIVQSGGVSIPGESDYSAILKVGSGYQELLTGIGYSESKIDDVFYGELRIDEVAGGSDYNILIESDDDYDAVIQVRKEITNNVKIYTTGKNNVILRQYTDSELSREKKAFTQIKLGTQNNIENVTEYLYEATITSVNKDDETIKASMNVTFNVSIPN